jgi:hypothetical protein
MPNTKEERDRKMVLEKVCQTRENSDDLIQQLQNNLRDINAVEIETQQQSAIDNQNNDNCSRNSPGNQQQEDEKDL